MEKKIITVVNGIKCFAKVNQIGWNTADVMIYIPHRKGQTTSFTIANGSYDWYDVFKTDTCDIVKFVIRCHYFYSAQQAVDTCASYITRFNKFVNFEAKDNLITKELLNIFK